MPEVALSDALELLLLIAPGARAQELAAKGEWKYWTRSSGTYDCPGASSTLMLCGDAWSPSAHTSSVRRDSF
jgi:hypothetical protein